MMDKWAALPQWLRWVLYAPTVFLLPILFSIFIVMLNDDFGRAGTTRGYIISLIGTAVFTASFVWLSLHLAPKANKLCAWIMFGLWSVLMGLTLVRVIYTWFWMGQGVTSGAVFELLQSLIWFSLGIWCLISFSKELSSTYLKSSDNKESE